MVVFNYYSTNCSLYQSDSDGSVSSGECGHHGLSAPVKCMWDTCGDWFPTLEELASHVAVNHAVAGKGGLFYCGWKGCSRGDRGFNARYKMLVHVRTHTNEKPHACPICYKSFSRAENLKIHARSHTGERPYICPVAGCGKAYSNSSDRFKHSRTHSIDKPYICKVPGCPKRYTDPSSLRKHVKTYRHCTSQQQKTADQLSPMYQPPVTRVPFCGQPAALPESTSWPEILYWYPNEQNQQYATACYTEQETPLDLTSPIRLQHRV
ncbi:ZnF_C2H2 [Nesidiocoris tenuis]|uniref:ZnF_C2H2 n=1 Tax=Nesidiocoris tenuis TaxID=355587 RepID=A0ABN7AN53_9HEMI|nr:ZnF_C2H2 [Nesidiocoris tenuis]